MILYLIRHACSWGNEQRLVTGTPNDSLSPAGQVQALALAEWLSKQSVRPERFITSHWNRARETASVVFPDAHWVTDTRLGETIAGAVADWPLSEFLEAQPDFYANPANQYPNGESHLDLNTRVIAWLEEQLRNPCHSIVVATHSGPITCILQHVLQVDMALFPALLPSHATVSVVHFSCHNGSWKGRVTGFALGPIDNTLGIFHGDH